MGVLGLPTGPRGPIHQSTAWPRPPRRRIERLVVAVPRRVCRAIRHISRP